MKITEIHTLYIKVSSCMSLHKLVRVFIIQNSSTQDITTLKQICEE